MNSYPVARVGVVGATGYAGCELLARLARHPGVELVAAMASAPGVAVPVAELVPAYHGRTAIVCQPAALDAMLAARPDFVFLATPHQVSMAWVQGLGQAAASTRIIDLSGAFRFPDAATFEQWYGMPHTAPAWLPVAVYGWPEKMRESIRGAALVANPGCYATAASTALWPLLRAGVVEADGIVCDAKSGASGAGKAGRDDLHFVALEGNCKAYRVYSHRHTPEIAEHAGVGQDFTFTPHLLPTARGILATTYLRLRSPLAAADLLGIYRSAYTGHPFVRVLADRLPEIQPVAHTNFCDLGFRLSPSGKQAVVVTCLDNLVKGAAGQALQNFNLMSGWPEETALL